MTEFSIQPCKLRDGLIVPLKNSERWHGRYKELLATFFFDADPLTVSRLQMMENFSFIGKVKNRTDKNISAFLLINKNLSNDVRWLIKSDRTLKDRIVSIFKVIEVIKKGEITEKNK